MKTEIDRICGIMYTLLEHQPVIDVPYEKINDIAVALVKDGYGKISEYETEREMLGSQIKVLKQRLNNKYIEIDNLNRDYRNSFERLKAQGREIEQLKKLKKQAQIDVLNNVKDVLANQKHECLERNNLTGYSAICGCEKYIDELIKEVENE